MGPIGPMGPLVSAAEPIGEQRISPPLVRLAHGPSERPSTADDCYEPFAAGNARVEQVPAQHQKVLRVQRDDDRGIFRTLGFVDRAREREIQLIELAEIIENLPALKLGRQGTLAL